MEGVVIAIGTFVARGEVIPTVVEADAVFIPQVEPQSEVGIATEEELGKGLEAAKYLMETALALCIIDISISRTTDDANNGNSQLAVSGQPVKFVVLAWSEIVFHQVHGAEVAKNRNARVCVLQARDDPHVTVTLQCRPGMEAEAVVLRVDTTVKVLKVEIESFVGSRKAGQRTCKIPAVYLDLVAVPSVVEAPVTNCGASMVMERRGAAVIVVDGAHTCAQKQIERLLCKST